MRDGRIKILLQLGLQRNAEIPDVPNLLEKVTNPSQRQVLELLFARQEMGRPVVAPPGLPASRVALLRKALSDTAKDPAYLEDAEKMKFEVDFLPGEEMQQMLANIFALPKPVIDESKRLIAQALGSK